MFTYAPFSSEVIIAGSIVGLILGAAIYFHEPATEVKPIFRPGEIVTLKLDGTKTMVLYDYGCRVGACFYAVRQAQTLEIIYANEWELQR